MGEACRECGNPAGHNATCSHAIRERLDRIEALEKTVRDLMRGNQLRINLLQKRAGDLTPTYSVLHTYLSDIRKCEKALGVDEPWMPETSQIEREEKTDGND